MFAFVPLRMSIIQQIVGNDKVNNIIGWGMGICLSIIVLSHLVYFFVNGGLRILKDLVKGDIM